MSRRTASPGLGHKPVAAVDLFWLMAALMVLAGGLLIVGVYTVVNRVDAASRDRDRLIVRHGVEQRIKELAALVTPQSVWDDAVAHLDNRFDSGWADRNVAAYLSSINGFHRSMVIDAGDRLVYASVDGRPAPLAQAAPYAPTIASLVRKVREAERRRPPLTRAASGGKMITYSINASAVALIGGAPQIAVASLVQPDFGAAMPRGARAPIVIAAAPIDRRFLVALGDRYLLEGLALERWGAAVVPPRAAVALNDVAGRPIAQLAWLPQRPGRALFQDIVLPLMLALSLLAILVLLLMRRGSRFARELIASEARTAHLAYHDGLTGLPNRILMFDRMRQMLTAMRRSRQTIAIHCMDLDRFKEVNDTLGHQAGDELIRIAARRLRDLCGPDDFVARLGGDEFVLIQAATDTDGALRQADAAIAALSQPYELEFGRVFAGCSIGVTVVDNPDADSHELLRQADMALYKAKGAGRAQAALFEPGMDAALRHRRTLEADLRGALHRDQLFMMYQPVIGAAGNVTGVEALVRWTHPLRGAISPSVFVPLAEECGLIQALGDYVLRRVFAESAGWPGLRIAVNVSALQLRMPLFAEQVEALCRTMRVDPRRFDIEITETALLGDDPVTRRSILHLKRIGFAIALDDFGTGYSSLSCLQKYPVDKIKIDRSFIANIAAEEGSAAVVEAIVKLARALDMQVVAEGVETIEQRKRLAAAGCVDVQGHLFSPPVSAGEVAALAGLGSGRDRMRA
jgi:diguanylate cyclase (GGDEF)-like protein